MLPEDRCPFALSLEQWKQKSSIKMKIWLKANQEFIAECIRTKRQQDTKHLQGIRKSFKVIRHKKQRRKQQQIKGYSSHRKYTIKRSEYITKYIQRQTKQNSEGTNQAQEMLATQINPYYTTQGTQRKEMGK
eukprot:15366211-Ditylum_brightwellii.AAC.1